LKEEAALPYFFRGLPGAWFVPAALLALEPSSGGPSMAATVEEQESSLSEEQEPPKSV
jgi:hypothetical protein